MIYIFDSSSLIHLFNNYYRELFPSLWEKFDLLVDGNKIVSVREAYREIEIQDDELTQWAKNNMNLFPEPTVEELEYLRTFFLNDDYRNIVDNKKQRKGGLCADPFIIAKGKSADESTIVTGDGFSPKGNIPESFFDKDGNIQKSANKIAHICLKEKIDCMSLRDFMKNEGWSF